MRFPPQFCRLKRFEQAFLKHLNFWLLIWTICGCPSLIYAYCWSVAWLKVLFKELFEEMTHAKPIHLGMSISIPWQNFSLVFQQKHTPLQREISAPKTQPFQGTRRQLTAKGLSLQSCSLLLDFTACHWNHCPWAWTSELWVNLRRSCMFHLKSTFFLK